MRQQKSGRYFPQIDGIRALAVLSVIIYHVNPSLLPGGFVGVDIFFVISGYVISQSLRRDADKEFTPFILGFYRRRILRIFPALIVCVVLTSVLAVLFVPEGWLSFGQAMTAEMSLFSISNFAMLMIFDGYFHVHSHFNPFGHTWSLSVEEQFYMLFPVIFFFSVRSRRNGTGRVRSLPKIVPALVIASLIWAIYETNSAPERAFYMLTSRFWELALGAVLFQFQSLGSGGFHRSVWLNASAKVGLALIAASLLFADANSFPFPWALPACSGTALLIAAITSAPRSNSILMDLLKVRPVRFIGVTSYSLYLWHWPVIVLLNWTVGVEFLGYIPAVVLIFSLAIASYLLVETPVRGLGQIPNLSDRTTVLSGILLIVVAAGAVDTLYKYKRELGLYLSVTSESCTWSALYDPSCPDSVIISRPELGKGRRLLVIGDSHATAYTAMAFSAAKSVGASARIYTEAGCLIAALHENSNTKYCSDVNERILDWVDKNAKPKDVVLLASLRVPRLSQQWTEFNQEKIFENERTEAARRDREIALGKAMHLVEQLQSRGLIVVMDAPKPVFRSPLFRCSDWFNSSNPVCSGGFTVPRETLEKLRANSLIALEKIHNKQGVTIWDPFYLLCPEATCSAISNGMPMFHDGDHLSGFGNRVLAPHFAKVLRTLLESNNIAGAQNP